MSVTTTCRDIKELLPVAQQACKLLFQECYKAGLTNIFVTETYRSQVRQNYLYEQGRTRPGQKVTWTRSSNHSGRLAWDIAVAPPESLYDVSTLSKVGAIARKLGITWGGDWPATKIDRPHFEVKGNWKMPSGYKMEGEIVVPTDSKTKVKLTQKEEPIVAERDINVVSKWAEKDWKEAEENGYFDGTRPGAPITREEAAIVINRLRKNLLESK